jgi:hypothetical protein
MFDRGVPQSKEPIDLRNVRCVAQFARWTLWFQTVRQWGRFVVSGNPKTTNLVE